MKKKKNDIKNTTEEFELTLDDSIQSKYILRLYITGTTPKSARAIENIKKICDEYLEGRFDLEVIDLYQKPDLAKEEQIIAAPTLIKKLPLPLQRIIGDMSNKEKILIGLDLKKK